MPLPKRRHSAARGAKRRTHWKLGRPQLVACPQCKAMRLPHRVCPVCGAYAGRTAVEIEVKEKKKKKES